MLYVPPFRHGPGLIYIDRVSKTEKNIYAKRHIGIIFFLLLGLFLAHYIDATDYLSSIIDFKQSELLHVRETI